MIHTKPKVGVSQCLLGDAVRYDGKSKANNIVLEKFCDTFTLIAVCPEVEAGLSIPRPAMQLTDSIENPRITGRDDPAIDVTEIMHSYCVTKPAEFEQLSGFIFKARSPSCGLISTPVFIDNVCATDKSRGVFARAICKAYPDLPVIEEAGLETKDQRDSFIQAVLKRHAS